MPELKRTLNPETKAEIRLHLNGRQVEAINKLVESGYWGSSAAACAMRLMDSALLNEMQINPVFVTLVNEKYQNRS